MQHFIVMLLLSSLSTSLIALFYVVIMPFLARHCSVRGRYYAWLIIIVGFIIPFRPTFDFTMLKINISEIPFQVAAIGNGGIAPIEASTQPAVAGISWWQVAFVAWVAGAITTFAYQLLKHHRFLKMVERWSEAVKDESILRLHDELKKAVGVYKKIDIFLCPCIGSPAMIGCNNPRILLPTLDLTEDDMAFILKHELVHYKQKDLLYKFLVLIAVSIQWFNPIAYLSAKVISVLCEMSCDAEVVIGTDSKTRQHYCEAIIGVVRQHTKMKTVLSTNFYGGKKGMKSRISSIMEPCQKRAGIAVVVFVTLLMFGTMTVFAISPSATSPMAEGNLLPTSYATFKSSMSGNFTTINAGKELQCNTHSTDIVYLKNSGETWNFQENQTVKINLRINGDGSMSGMAIGYVYINQETGIQEAVEIASYQIIDTTEIDFKVPTSGEYYFFFGNFSASDFELDYFNVK